METFSKSSSERVQALPINFRYTARTFNSRRLGVSVAPRVEAPCAVKVMLEIGSCEKFYAHNFLFPFTSLL